MIEEKRMNWKVQVIHVRNKERNVKKKISSEENKIMNNN